MLLPRSQLEAAVTSQTCFTFIPPFILAQISTSPILQATPHLKLTVWAALPLFTKSLSPACCSYPNHHFSSRLHFWPWGFFSSYSTDYYFSFVSASLPPLPPPLSCPRWDSTPFLHHNHFPFSAYNSTRGSALLKSAQAKVSRGDTDRRAPLPPAVKSWRWTLEWPVRLPHTAPSA